MKTEGWIFAGCGFFFILVAVVYGILSREWIGTTALVLSGGLGLLVAFYLLFTARRIDPMPEDDPQGEIAEGAGEYGFYSPHSWWPMAVAGAAAVVGAGVVFAWWLAILGVVLLVLAVIGFTFEYYRGYWAQ